MTLKEVLGNMPLNRVTWQPIERLPSCIKVNLIKGIAINAVGLSNFGIEAALATGRWQTRTDAFMLSFMPVSKTKEGRLAETRAYVRIMLPALATFRGRVALQVNLSCPNTGEDLRELELEALEILLILSELGIPLIPKFNIMTTPQTVAWLASEVAIAGVCVSNTIPYGKLADKIKWKKMFGEVSPLAHLGGGGLSGEPLFFLVLDWVRRARQSGLTLPINAGGGIMHHNDVDMLYDEGATSVSTVFQDSKSLSFFIH